MTAPDSAEGTAAAPVVAARIGEADAEDVVADPGQPSDAAEASDAEADPAGITTPADPNVATPADPTVATPADPTVALDVDPVIPPAEVPPAEVPAAEVAAAEARWAPEGSAATALTWVDAGTVADTSAVPAFDADPSVSGASLLTGARLRPAFAAPGLLVPLGVVVGLVAAYSGATLLWPLHEVAPTVQTVEFETAPSAAAAITWPAQGSAAVGIDGIGITASTADRAAIASITKVVSTLMVLDRLPLAVGEQGPSFSFTRADSREFMNYKRGDQSALDVPVGGTLTEYQMLQGVLLGSANNYIDRLAEEIWGSDREFANAAETWLSERGLTGITIVTPSGFDERNTATPEALIAVAERAMQNPVFAEIVGTASVDLPGAGVVKNSNGMLADAGVVGVKTGTLYESWNLLTAKDVTVDDTTVRLFAAVLTQEDNDARLEATRALFAQVESQLQSQGPAVAKGTVVGRVETAWGASADVITDADADVVLWNGAAATATADFDLGEHRAKGAEVGTLTTVGPLDTVSTPLELAKAIADPSPWWRLTHPLELFGLTAEQR
ncbi:D-alanyl-D-alanine carboxypeptidase family protein [Streptomyces sp. AC495_CC817]|uniref:D-alanyl-D-alanine carboxypeptidase family protein n=1 Tax=Streptomyces sp. AC495_CC817 TaxID=2823900 RepID=UPI001C25A59D|nr:hypothetical protein [Streptomyces sp. AC495_CC817]